MLKYSRRDLAQRPTVGSSHAAPQRRICAMAAGALFCCLVPLGGHAADPLSWNAVTEGLDVAIWTPGATCSEGISTVVVRIDSEVFEFTVHQFEAAGLPSPLPLLDWQRRTGASLLFNAGLFLDDFSYMGLLYSNGQALNRKRHAQWQGLFVAEPVEVGMRQVRVLDLTFDTFLEEPPPYKEAAQALMLLDRTGKVRVRQSGKRAQQTLVGEDGKGFMYVIKTVTAASLFGLGECLHQTFPWLHQVMAMDGGSSSDLLVGPDLLLKAGKAVSESPWRAIVDGTAPAAHIPLPTVIGVTPRATSRRESASGRPAKAPAAP